MGRLSAIELRAARDRRAPGFQVVFSQYSVEDGCIEIRDWTEKRKYFPLTARSLLQDFGRVQPGSARSALKFVDDWGALGFQSVLRGSGGPLSTGGDPLPWIWLHANGVRIALSLIRLLAEPSDKELADYIARLRLTDDQKSAEAKVSLALHNWRTRGIRPANPDKFVRSAQQIFEPSNAPPGEFRSLVPEYVCGNRTRSARLSHGLENSPPRDVARGIIAGIINPNLRGVVRQIAPPTDFLPDEPGRNFTLVQTADSVMSAIYEHLAELAIGTMGVFLCQECNSPFNRRKGRGDFCPPPPWSKSRASRCYESFKKREWRRDS